MKAEHIDIIGVLVTIAACITAYNIGASISIIILAVVIGAIIRMILWCIACDTDVETTHTQYLIEGRRQDNGEWEHLAPKQIELKARTRFHALFGGGSRIHFPEPFTSIGPALAAANQLIKEDKYQDIVIQQWYNDPEGGGDYFTVWQNNMWT